MKTLKFKITEIEIHYNDETCIQASGYNNGRFIPSFRDAHLALAKSSDLAASDFKVIHYILSIVDENNAFRFDPQEAANLLSLDVKTVKRSIKKLAAMQFICIDKNNKRRYLLGEYLLNPRVGFVGNTRKINKENLPNLISRDGTPMIPEAIISTVTDNDDDFANISFDDEIDRES